MIVLTKGFTSYSRITAYTLAILVFVGLMGKIGGDWSQGVPIGYHKEFCEYWANDYDWYATQDRLNRFAQYTTNLDGLNVHFIHVKSSHATARPLLLTHGWPGSVVEFHKTIEPLAEPARHGGTWTTPVM